MRRLLLCSFFIMAGFVALAQSLDDIQLNISRNAYAQAKVQIDQFLSLPANQSIPNAWYYKGKVYTELYRADSTNSLGYDASREAFNAFKKYEELDRKDIMMMLDQHVGLFQLYDANYNRGIASYNVKSYSYAFDKLKAANELEEYISNKGFIYNGFSFPAVDTQLVNLTGSSAYLAKKENEAIPYFKKLADAGIASPDYREVYSIIAEYYQKKGDRVNADKYFSLGKKFFPGDDYWISIEFGDPGRDTLVRFKRYEDLMKKYPGNYSLAMDYAIENFNYTYSYDTKPGDYVARQQKLESALLQVLAIRATAMANYVMTKHVSNMIYDLEDNIRVTTDAAKKKMLNDRRDELYEALRKYAQAAFDIYTAEGTAKPQDKLNYRQVAEALADYYDLKKDKAKADFYREKMKIF